MVLSDRQNPEHRNCFYIVSDILGVVTLFEEDSGKTKIMYKANLSFVEMRDYLKIMLDAGLLQESKKGERKIYKATQRGREYMESFGKTKQLLKPIQKPDNQGITMPPEYLLVRAQK